MSFQPGVLPGKFGGGVRPASQNSYPIYDKNCDFLYPIYDLTKNLKAHLWPHPYIKNPVSDQCLIIVNIISEGLLFIFFSIMMKKWLLLDIIHIKARIQKPYSIYDQNS